jgi:hypothetical protein
MKIKIIISIWVLFVFFLFDLKHFSLAGELSVRPTISLQGEYDDNIDWDQNDEIDDFSVSVIPQISLNYLTELLSLNLRGLVDVKRYISETDFDRVNQLYGIDSEYQLSSRWSILGEFEFRKDETIDSQIEETGRAFDRESRHRYKAGGGMRYILSELSDIGPNFTYRRVTYGGSDNEDYNSYTFELPWTKRFKNQKDELSLIPGYFFFDSDTEDAREYRFTSDWKHLFSETFSTKLILGVRYTETEEKTNNEDEGDFGGIGGLTLFKDGLTYSSEIGYLRDLRVDSDGELVQVDRAFLRLRKKLLERLAFNFYGAGYYSQKVSDKTEDDNVRYFELRPSFIFSLTARHNIELAYSYQRQEELDDPGNPVTQRNRVWLVLNFTFPHKF